MGNSASALPYSIGAQVTTLHDGWSLHEGSRKSDSAPVSVFKAHKPAMTKTPLNPRMPRLVQAPVALHHFQHCKKLRHPHILQVYATLDTDNPTEKQGVAEKPPSSKETGDWIIVTEPCIPLQDWLDTPRKPHELAWGLQCIVESLVFLHTSAKLVHGNVSEKSFFVTRGGDVKLWEFGLVTSLENGGPSQYFREYEAFVCPYDYRSPERRESRWDAVASCAPHAMDSYSVGILIGYLYRDRIPPPLQKAVQRLHTPNVRARPRLAPLLKCPVFDTPYQKVQKMLEEMTVQPVENKVAFWQNLPSMLQNRELEEAVAKYKILPIMKQSIMTICGSEAMLAQDMYRREVLAILPPLFFIAETYLTKEPDLFASELSPVVTLLFGVNDRGVRGALLGRVNLFGAHMDKNQLNSAVFEPMCSGFADSSPALRELTLKATIVLVSHLTAPNLEKLSRYLVRLQSDPESSIRTNTVIFMCKLAPCLTEMNRQKMLLPSYMRAMKDPFEPCRLAALQSLQKSKEVFNAESVATKVLPAIMPHLLDPSAGVRREAFQAVEVYLAVLKKEDQRLLAIAEANPPPPVAAGVVPAQAPSAGAPVPGAPSSAGYLSGFSSWMSSSAQPTQDGAVPVAAAPPPVAAARTPYNAAPAAPPAMSSLSLNNNAAALTDDFGDDDGWDDDDDDLLGLGDSPIKQKSLISMDPVSKQNAWSGLGDSPIKQKSLISTKPVPKQNAWSGLGDSPIKQKGLISTKPVPKQNAWSDGNDDDFFASFDSSTSKPKRSSLGGAGSKLVIPKKSPKAKTKAKPKPDVTKLAVDNNDWDDF